MTRISGVHWDEVALTQLADAFGDQRIVLTQKLTPKELGELFPHAVTVMHRRPWLVVGLVAVAAGLILWGGITVTNFMEQA